MESRVCAAALRRGTTRTRPRGHGPRGWNWGSGGDPSRRSAASGEVGGGLNPGAGSECSLGERDPVPTQKPRACVRAAPAQTHTQPAASAAVPRPTVSRLSGRGSAQQLGWVGVGLEPRRRGREPGGGCREGGESHLRCDGGVGAAPQQGQPLGTRGLPPGLPGRRGTALREPEIRGRVSGVWTWRDSWDPQGG